MTKTEKAVARGLYLARPERPSGMTNDVPVIVVAWAVWNRTVDRIAEELERSGSATDPKDFIEAAGTERTVPFDDVEVRA